MRVYLASGWFTEEQERTRLDILDILNNLIVEFAAKNTKFSYYSPKDHGVFIPGKTDPKKILTNNIEEIHKSNFIVAAPGSESKNRDTGTVWECGYAYAIQKPVIYFWPTVDSINLMLGMSAQYVATSEEDLIVYLRNILAHGFFGKNNYTGEIE
jgi:nucleoside 2-deoxyribosyltransferase